MRYFLTMLGLLLCSAGVHAALYKWVDANGEAQYSDGPPPVNVKAEKVRTPSAASGVAPVKSVAEQEADYRKAQKARQDAAQKAAQAEADAQDRKRNCDAARGNLAALQSSQRLTTYNAAGEVVLMDDAMRQQGLEEARKQISTYCD